MGHVWELIVSLSIRTKRAHCRYKWPNHDSFGLLGRRGAAEPGEGATEPAGAHEDQHKAADDDPANAASVAARLGVVRTWWRSRRRRGLGDGGGGEGDGSEGVGRGGEGDGGGVDGGSAKTTVVVGTFSTVRPSAVEAASAVPRVKMSEVCT